MRARLRSVTHGPVEIRAAAVKKERAAVGTLSQEREGADVFERRMRETDGPVDRAHYACACGFQFAAPVATTVRCPHCGAGQAW